MSPRFTVYDVSQGSPEWFALRLRNLTGSRSMEAFTKTKAGAWGAGRKNLIAEMLLEHLTDKSQASDFCSPAMAAGKEREGLAGRTYEAVAGTALIPTGFILLNDHRAGCSLDGHVGEFEGIVEIKSPLASTHLEYLKSGRIPADYMRQVRHNLWVTGAAWCDWFSFHPDFPDALQVKIVRVTREEADIPEYEAMALAFLAEVENEVNAVRAGLLGISGVLEAAGRNVA